VDPASIAMSLMAAKAGQTQMAAAAKIMKTNADQGKAVVDLLNAAQDNMSKMASLAAGVGTQLDISV
jgi:hypothetical protein